MSILIKGKTVHFDDRYVHVELDDGRVILTPMSWYQELQAATFKQLTHYQFICQGTGSLNVSCSVSRPRPYKF
ncbi:MAG: DUF2442 domain-containing protein [Methylococcales bacterium]|jgi:hypothetical protein|nr:DUF2442 domain-containing protein [Methylococcales bacterium]